METEVLKIARTFHGTTGAADDKPISILFMGQSEPLMMGIIYIKVFFFFQMSFHDNW